MGGPVEISGDQLRSIVERIEHIEEEIKELNEGKREIFQEAKSNGFDVKVIREIVRWRKQDQKERECGHAMACESGETMSRRPRRNHPPAFKSKVALAAVKGDRTLAQLAEQFDVHAP